MQEGPSPYTIHPTARLKGPLNVAVLERALNELFRRHESLRTTFVATDDGLMQLIAPHTPRQLEVTDLSGLPVSAREEEVRRCSEGHSRRPMDPAEGPLMHVAL